MMAIYAAMMEEIDNNIDVNLIKQMILNNAFDPSDFMKLIENFIKKMNKFRFIDYKFTNNGSETFKI